MQRNVKSLLLTLLLLISSNALAKDIKVVFINPGHPEGDATGAFWSDVSRFMQAAADDLDIELVTLFANRDHILMKRLASYVAQHQPDYAIIVNEKGAGLDVFKTIARHNIPTFTLLNTFSALEQSQLTDEQKSLFIGSVIPDNYLAGQNLAESLYTFHEKNHSASALTYFLALQGDYRSAASTRRERGLMNYIESNKSIQLLDSSVASWSKEEAYEKVKGLIQRHRIDVIWAANDPMAIGARQAVQEVKPPYPVTIGGINWDIADKHYPIDVSYGGHVVLGAKALVMLHDHHSKLRETCEMKLKLDIFKSSQQNKLSQFSTNTQGDRVNQFDFSRFTKQHPKAAAFNLMTFVTGKYQNLSKLELEPVC